MVKHLLSMQETWVQSLGQEDPLKKGTATTPALLPGKSHGQKSLIGYSPWGRKESDTTEQLHFTVLLYSLHLSLPFTSQNTFFYFFPFTTSDTVKTIILFLTSYFSTFCSVITLATVTLLK